MNEAMDVSIFITANLDEFGQLIKLDKLYPELERNKFLDCENIQRYKNLPNENEQKSFILEQVNNENFGNFLQILIYVGHDTLAQTLAKKLRNIDLNDMIDLSRCHPKDGHANEYSFKEKREMEELVVRDSSLSSSSAPYLMLNEPRGYCLLINNHFTVGTYKEMQRFRDIFYQLHFDVIVKKNINKIEISNIMKEISTSNELDKHNAFVFMIIAHGNSKQEIYGFDGQPMKIRDIMDMVNNENCPKLTEKPRVFFFNCCRGDRTQFDSSTRTMAETGSSDSNGNQLSAMQDEFVSYSTLQGFTAQVNWHTGTPFGNALAEILVQKAWYKNLNSIMTRTNNSLRKSSNQPFEVHQALNSEFYFFPDKPHVKKLKKIQLEN